MARTPSPNDVLKSSPPRLARPGPKPRLSRELIVEAACALLAQSSSDQFTMADLAKRLDAGVMTLYRYFPNRDALLDAVAAHLLNSFKPPQIEGNPWQKVVLGWLQATQQLWDEHPVVLKVIFLNGRHSLSWLKIWWVPLAQLFEEQGVDDARLAFAMSWITTVATGMIVTDVKQPSPAQAAAVSPLHSLTSAEELLTARILPRIAALERDTVRQFAYQNLVQGLEALFTLPASPLKRSMSNRRHP